MSKYRKRRERIWMIQVRGKGTNEIWSPTGPDWFRTRKEALADIARITWDMFEYRARRYGPTED